MAQTQKKKKGLFNSSPIEKAKHSNFDVKWCCEQSNNAIKPQ